MRTFISAVLALGAVVIAFSSAVAQDITASYVAHLRARDHFASDGVRLTTVADILRQDRANYHKFGKQDADDESDDYFSTARARESFERLVRNGEIQPNVRRAILNGTPRVIVTVYRDDDGRPYLGVVLEQR